MKKITYEYRSEKVNLEKSTYIFDGKDYVIDKAFYEPCWAEGSEVVSDEEVDARVYMFTRATDENGKNKYRNIQVADVD